MKQQDKNKMQSLYKEWLGSGVSRAGFAKGHGIAPNTFNYWIKKFQGTAIVKSNFNQISIEAPLFNTSRPTAVIHFTSGAKIELYGQPEVSFLKELIL